MAYTAGDDKALLKQKLADLNDEWEKLSALGQFTEAFGEMCAWLQSSMEQLGESELPKEVTPRHQEKTVTAYVDTLQGALGRLREHILMRRNDSTESAKLKVFRCINLCYTVLT